MKLAPMLFVRPGELRRAEWSEIDLDKAEWRIPAAKMKGRAMHIVPLAKQAVQILQELKPLTGHSTWVFPGVRTNGEPMSENTVNAALVGSVTTARHSRHTAFGEWPRPCCTSKDGHPT